MGRAKWFFWMFPLVLVLSGCPWPIQEPTFTSAFTRNSGDFDGGAEAGEGEGEGEAPGVDDGGGREVVEPDVIRRVDNLLYVLNQYRGLTIVDLDAGILLAQVPTLGYPRDLYFAGGQAYVLVGVPGGGGVAVAEDASISFGSALSRLYVVDVADPEAASIRSEIDIEGDLVDSRLVGDILYTVTAEYTYYYGPEGVGNENGSLITSIDVSDPDNVAQADALEFSGAGHVLYVNFERAFVASADWMRNETEITVLDITDPAGQIAEAGAVRVRGYVGDRFKMDEWEGALRVVTSTWEETSQVYVSTFDLGEPGFPQLAEMALEGAEGETLFATRFDGARAYVVTFLVVDPLFVLDLSDPAAPALLGALEVPGYSTHIEARGDRLIALGVDDTAGRQVSVSIFDVSGNGAPTLADRVNFGGDWSWSNAYGDVKALTVLDDVIIVPFSGWSGESGGFERLQFISYTQDELQLRGDVDLNGSILRSFAYDADYFGVTTEQVARIDGSDLDNPVVTQSITIAENLVDFIELPSGVGVEIVERYDEGQVLIRTSGGELEAPAEVVVSLRNFSGAHLSGDTLALVGVSWEDTYRYDVALVDLSDPAAPVAGDVVPVNVTPYNHFYGYWGGGYGPEPGRGMDEKDVAIGIPYYSFSGPSAFVIGDTLALRCFADSFDSTIGRAQARQGLALIDLETGAWESTVGLGYENIVSLDQSDELLYLGTTDPVQTGFLQRPLTAYYIRALDIAAMAAGPAANVPGAFVQYDAANDVLTLRDQQWALEGGLTFSLRTVRWDGDGAVTPLDRLEIPGYGGTTAATGGAVYFDAYEPTYGVYQAMVASDGTLDLGGPVAIDGYYGAILGAHGDQVFVSAGWGSIAQVAFADGAGEVVGTTPVAGYPNRVRFGADAAHFALGYFGLVSIGL